MKIVTFRTDTADQLHEVFEWCVSRLPENYTFHASTMRKSILLRSNRSFSISFEDYDDELRVEVTLIWGQYIV